MKSEQFQNWRIMAREYDPGHSRCDLTPQFHCNLDYEYLAFLVSAIKFKLFIFGFIL